MNASVANSDLRAVHLEEIGPDYAITLRRWRENFIGRLKEAKQMGYSSEFLRLWHFYLCYCEAGFQERHVGDIQVVFDKPGCRELAPNRQHTNLAPNAIPSLIGEAQWQ